MTYLGFRLCNLVIPGDAQSLDISTPSGIWHLERDSRYAEAKEAVDEGKIAETHVISTNVLIGSAGRSAAIDAAFSELVPICLAASYLTGNCVATTRSVPSSEITIMQPGPHFPRPRAMMSALPVVSNESSFKDRIEAFVRNHTTLGYAEKDRLLVHHWLDAMACWSMEDLCLSTATLLEIIAATARDVAAAGGVNKRYFHDRIDYAAGRFSLSILGSDFRDMRNDLVHEGTLSGNKFANKTVRECGYAATEALAWFDDYVHAALNLGPVEVKRFPSNSYGSLNAFSLD